MDFHLDRSDHAEHSQRHGHQAALADGLDFVNTLVHGGRGDRDELADLRTAIHWLHQHELLHSFMVDEQLRLYADDAVGEERTLARIRRARSALRELLDATVERRPADGAALREVNRALKAQYVYELVPAPDGVSLDHRHEGDPIAGALARLSETIARELTFGESGRLRVCANDECRWVFFDSSPAGRRKWCDMATCGNRAKAARHRARQRESTGPAA